MALTGLDDPGLTVFPTHRLLSGFAEDPERQRRLGEGLRELFDVTEVGDDELDPLGEEGVGVFGLYDSHHSAASGCGSRTTRSPRWTSSWRASPRPTAASTRRSSRRSC